MWKKTGMKSSHLHRSIALTVGLSAIAVLVLSRTGHRWQDVISEVSRVSPAVVATLLILATIQLCLQALRLYVLARGLSPLTFLETGRVHSVGQSLNAFLPARAGDVYKVTRFTKLLEVGGASSVGDAIGVVLGADKLSDLIATVALAAIFVPVVFEGYVDGVQFIEISRLFGPWVILLGMILVISGMLFPKLRESLGWVKKSLDVIFVRISMRRYMFAVSLAMASFAVECAALVVLTRNLASRDFEFFQALWALIAVNIGVAIPLTLANLGTFEASMVLALDRFGVGIELAIAIALIHHAVQIAASLLATVGFELLHRIRRQPEHVS